MNRTFQIPGVMPLAVAIFCLASSQLTANEPPTPAQPYSGEFGKPLEVTVDFRAIVTPPYHTEKLRVWVPIAPSDTVQQVIPEAFATFPMPVDPVVGVESKYGNRFAYFEFDHPKGAQIIQHRFRVTTREVRWNIDAETVAAPERWPKPFYPYLLSDEAVSITPEIESVLASFSASPSPKEASPKYSGLLKAIDWVDANLTYDHSNASLKGSSEHAIQKRRGHCSDYHGLCSAFGRALAFPTRITYGLALHPKNSPSHCKLEAFLPPYGWVSFDVSETQKMIKKIQGDEGLTADAKARLAAAARRRLHTGFRDEGWMLLTRGSDYDLAPPANHRVKVVRTIYAEADGEPLPEPDPADLTKREYGWMTAHHYTTSRPLKLSYKDKSTLEEYAQEEQSN